MKHKFYDDAITEEDGWNDIGIDRCYLKFDYFADEDAPRGVVIHKNDVIALANYFGLVVYEKGSALEVKNESQ